MTMIELTAKDGHRFQAYEATPANTSAIGVVVLQEVFGVNEHIRSVCDRLAQQGFHALAPAMFDRYSPAFETGYAPEDMARARSLMAGFDWEKAPLDMSASADYLARSNGKVAVMGFCLGGSLAYLASAKRIGDAAVSYYGGRIPQFLDQLPQTPIICHFGEHDAMIPMDGVHQLKERYPDMPVHVYDAGHGFNCDLRSSFDKESADLAWQRSVDFILENCSR